jgi:hypothetical protein
MNRSVRYTTSILFTTKRTKDTKVISEGTACRAPTLCVLCGQNFFPSCSSCPSW